MAGRLPKRSRHETCHKRTTLAPDGTTDRVMDIPDPGRPVTEELAAKLSQPVPRYRRLIWKGQPG